jgi:hypothetical protein
VVKDKNGANPMLKQIKINSKPIITSTSAVSSPDAGSPLVGVFIGEGINGVV